MPRSGTEPYRRLFRIRKVDGEWHIFKLDLCNRTYRYLTTKLTHQEAIDLVEPFTQIYRELLKNY